MTIRSASCHLMVVEGLQGFAGGPTKAAGSADIPTGSPGGCSTGLKGEAPSAAAMFVGASHPASSSATRPRMSRTKLAEKVRVGEADGVYQILTGGTI